MTHVEFESNCNEYWDVSDLVQFAYDESLDSITDEIYSEDGMNSAIDEAIADCRLSWQELRDELADIETGYDFYWCDGTGYFGFRPIDGDDFDTIKDRIERAMDGYWDDEDEDEVEESEAQFEDEHIDYSQYKQYEPDDDKEYEVPDFDAGALFDTCSGAVQTMCAMQECMKQKELEEFKKNVSSIDLSFEF